jgi:Mor family transcriptional regulator
MKHAIQMMKTVCLVAIISIAFGAYSTRANPVFSLKIPVLQATGGSKSAQDSKAKKPKKEKKAKAKKGGGVTFYEGSGETRAERDKRLTRECRGRSNSGLCEGYARP